MKLTTLCAFFLMTGCLACTASPLPAPKNGTKIYTPADGGKIMILPNGSTFIRFPDGVELTKDLLGNRTYIYPNGDRMISQVDGKMDLYRKNGSHASMSANGTVSVLSYPSLPKNPK